MLSNAGTLGAMPSGKPLSDGTVVGLYLVPGKKAGTGKWILRYVSPVTSKRREMGLGRYPETSIEAARLKGTKARGIIRDGQDPLEACSGRYENPKPDNGVPTFEEAARLRHAETAKGFRNRKHIEQWITTLERYVFPEIGQRPVNTLGSIDFAACLKPIWLAKPETASRIRQRCVAVIDWAAASGYTVSNPVSVVEKLLAKQPGKRQRVAHYPALAWRNLPSFFANVLHKERASSSVVMLEFLILTVSRSGEVRRMCWDEIDFSNLVWTVPASRIKAGVAHRVPLTPRCVDILEKQGDHFLTGNGLVFPSRKATPMSDMTLTKILRDKNIVSDTPGRVATAHGFRSSFRDWASENGFPRDVAERSLAHTINNQSEAAYHRTDLLERRRSMMAAWERYCLSDVLAKHSSTEPPD